MPLLDAYGRPIVIEALREEQAAPTLLGIRNIYSIIDESIGLTPEKVAGILRTAEFGDPWLYLELAERMEEKDLLYQGVLHTRKMAVSQLDIDVQAAGDDAQSIEDSEFIRDILIDSSQVDLHDVVFEMLDALGKGFSATEIIWDFDGVNVQTGAPYWLPFALKWRDPRWFMFDWVSGEQLLVRTLSGTAELGPQLPVGRESWDSRLSPMNLRVRSRHGGAADRDSAGDLAVGAVQVHHAYHAGQGGAADSRRPRADRNLGLPLQELRAQRLGGVRRGLRPADAARQVRAGRHGG